MRCFIIPSKKQHAPRIPRSILIGIGICVLISVVRVFNFDSKLSEISKIRMKTSMALPSEKVEDKDMNTDVAIDGGDKNELQDNVDVGAVYTQQSKETKTPGDLASCDELMRKHRMYKDGSFLTKNTTEVVWKMRADRSREITLPSTCRLKRYTADEALTCLKNKNLYFIGDSLTRYLFLSLTYFLEHKQWPMRFHAGRQPCDDHIDDNGNKSCSNVDEPNVCVSGDWSSWRRFYTGIGGGTDGSVYHGRMECMGVRGPDIFVDNMEYVSSEEYGYDHGRTKLSYHMETRKRKNPDQIFEFTGCAYNASCRYTMEEYQQLLERAKKKNFDGSYQNYSEAFGPKGTKFHSLHQNTNYMIYNRGIWAKNARETAEEMVAHAKHMLSFAYQITGGDGGRTESKNRCFFRSTTGAPSTRELREFEAGSIRDATLEAGCEYFDIAQVTEEFSRIIEGHPDTFVDTKHYVPWVYEELNNLLLNVLCNTHQVVE